LKSTKQIRLHKDSRATIIHSQKARPKFDDTLDWWFDCDGDACTGAHAGRYQPGWNSVNVPKTGTTIEILWEKQGLMGVEVNR
jgi:immune inhibitor A